MAQGPNVSMTTMNQPGNWWSGLKPTMAGVDIYNQNQTDTLNNLIERAMGGLDPSKMSLEPENQRIMSQFNKQIIPSIASRFANMGEGAMGSSGFQGALGGAMGDLGERLQANTAQYNRQMAPMYMGMLGAGLQPRQEQMFMPGTSGMSGQLMEALSSGLGQLISNIISGQGGMDLLKALLGAGGGGGSAAKTGMGGANYFGGGVGVQSLRSAVSNPAMLGLV